MDPCYCIYKCLQILLIDVIDTHRMAASFMRFAITAVVVGVATAQLPLLGGTVLVVRIVSVPWIS